MAKVRIYRPARNAMQSGLANTRHWVMEFEPEFRETHDPLMGWISSRDTQGQVMLRFDSEGEAVAYAKRQGYEYSLVEPHRPEIRPKSYADNFRWTRIS
jgi:hypothetical protein